MRRVIMALMLLVSVSDIFAQTPAGAQQRGPMPMDGSVTGKVVDINNIPIEYASVGLYSLRDSSLVTGMVTDTSGNFTLSRLPYGRFYAQIKFIGYKKTTINAIRVTPDQKTASLGVIKLQNTASSLNEVVITGNRPPIEYKIDKKVVNVDQQIAASGGSAVEVLENTPSVQTDVEGNVTLRGSSSFTVLIDGKPSVLKGSEALQQIPASTIQQIEIITNPSAKYDPDGSAGIINVIMKRQKMVGISGMVNLSAGTGDKYTGDVLLNIRTSKFNYFVGGDFNDFQFKMKGIVDQRTLYRDTLNYQEATTNGKMHRSGARIKGGIDYYINDKNTLSLSGNISDRSFQRSTSSNYYEYKVPTLNDRYYVRENNSKSPRRSIDGTLDYLLKFKKDGHQLAASLYYSYEPEKNTTDMIQQATDGAFNPGGLPSFSQQSTESGAEKEFRAKLDYTLPVAKTAKLEAGYQGRVEGVNGEYHFFNGPVEDPLQYNKIKFTDHIESVYATFSNSGKIIEYQLGLRGEYTDRNLVKQLTGQEYPINRFDFFPTIHLSRQLPWNMQVLASYSRRINRPGDRELDPFVSYVDQHNIRQGNPALRPEFADSYELNFQKRMGAGFISLEGYYKQTHDLISQTYMLVDTITVQSFANYNSDYSLGTEAMINMPITKWWTLNATTSAYKYHINATGNDSAKNTITWNSRFNSTFQFKWGMQIQANFFYNAPSITPQGKREGFYFTTIGLRQELFKKKASLTLQARDLFGNMKFANTSEAPGLYRFNSFKRESPVFMLTFSYRINNFKQQMRRNNENGNDQDYNGGGEDM